MRSSNAPAARGRQLLAGAGLLLAAVACSPTSTTGTTGTPGPAVSASSGPGSSTSTSGRSASTSSSVPSTDTTARATTTGPSAPTTTAPSATTSTTPTPSTATTAPVAALVLRGDGLGVATFGQDADAAAAALVAALGPASEDSGWRPANAGMEPRPNRMLSWGGLWVTFIEQDGARTFTSWRLSGYASQVVPEGADTPKLAVGNGIALGLTYDEVAPLLGATTTVDGEGASGLRVTHPEGPVYVWFDPPLAGEQPPAKDAVVVVIDAGEATSHAP